MLKRLFLGWVSYIVGSLLLVAPLGAQQVGTPSSLRCTLQGHLVDRETKASIIGATVELLDYAKGAVSNERGAFVLANLRPATYHLRIRCLGYQTTEVMLTIRRDTTVAYQLQPLSFALKEVEVMASFVKNKSSVLIEQEALRHIQPTSLNDLMLLLPGSVTASPGVGSFKGASVRQVGSDDNSSLGVSLQVDGTPLTNDATRTQIEGLTGQSRFDSYVPDRLATRRGSLNSGIDLRTISTDHFARVEIDRGISSASEGNLSSGTLKLHPKRGKSPLSLRAKTDPLYKLLYVGKGLSLGEHFGDLHLGLDWMDYKSDAREKLDRYNRISGQASYSKQFGSQEEGTIDFTATLLHTTSLQNSRTDELVEELDERYHTQYSRTTLSTQSIWRPRNFFPFDHLQATLSIDYTYDLLDRKKFYISGSGPRCMPLSPEPGVHEGQYLPLAYYTLYQVENKPLYLFAKLHASKDWDLSSSLRLSLYYGAESRWAKNWGQGAVTDVQRPPFPADNAYVFPRPNREVPALAHGAGYVESRWQWSQGGHTLMANLGGRLTYLFNLPSDYLLRGKPLWEPRLRAAWNWKTDEVSMTLRGGYGEENKLPTLDYLYPDKKYYYFVVLNAYFSDPKRDHLMTYTVVHDPANPEIKANKNRKGEIGLDWQYKGYTCSLTAFSELSLDGFSYASAYYPIKYPIYERPIAPIDDGSRPEPSDYYSDTMRDFARFLSVRNSEKIYKRGIEYRIRTPHYEAIRTRFELNGAYYHTVYGSSLPVYYRPSLVENGVKFPYVGFYGEGSQRHYVRFNSNLWCNTHVPEWGVIFTNFIQVIWHDASFLGREQSEYPYAYMDLDGAIHSIDKEMILQAEKDGSLWRHLSQSHNDLYYQANLKPVSVRMNLKATKELGKHLRLAFFVDNVFDFSPKYKRKDKTTDREWFVPYFGMEAQIQF